MIADNAPCCEISPESLTTIVSDEEPSSTSRMPVFETAFPTTPMKIAPNIAMNMEFNKANIRYADSGKFKKIVNRGHLKTDPVEWTEKYEKVIDAAEKEAYAKLSGMPRGMGFCHAYWCAKSEALAKRGIDWRSPSLMNPGVLFD